MEVDKVVTVASVTVSNETNVTVSNETNATVSNETTVSKEIINTRLWQPSWLRETNVKVSVPVTRNSGFKITTRNTRAASDLVKAEVLTKVEQMVTSFTSVITRELTKPMQLQTEASKLV